MPSEVRILPLHQARRRIFREIIEIPLTLEASLEIGLRGAVGRIRKGKVLEGFRNETAD